MTVTGLSWLAAAGGAAAVLSWPDRAQSLPVPVPVPRSDRRVGRASQRSTPVVDADQLLELVEMVAVQVRAGAAPTPAWHAAQDVLGLRQVGFGVSADDWLAEAGRHVPAALAARAGWLLAERTGAPLAEVLDGVARVLRDDQAEAAEVQAALAAPQATVRLLTVLPLGAVLLGELIGAQPLQVLTSTGPGRACGVLGLLLLVLGRWWMRRLVRVVGRER